MSSDAMLLIALIAVLLSFNAVYTIVPIIVIVILIAAAAGLMRGMNIFAFFGFNTLTGMSRATAAGRARGLTTGRHVGPTKNIRYNRQAGRRTSQKLPGRGFLGRKSIQEAWRKNRFVSRSATTIAAGIFAEKVQGQRGSQTQAGTAAPIGTSTPLARSLEKQRVELKKKINVYSENIKAINTGKAQPVTQTSKYKFSKINLMALYRRNKEGVYKLVPLGLIPFAGKFLTAGRQNVLSGVPKLEREREKLRTQLAKLEKSIALAGYMSSKNDADKLWRASMVEARKRLPGDKEYLTTLANDTGMVKYILSNPNMMKALGVGNIGNETAEERSRRVLGAVLNKPELRKALDVYAKYGETAAALYLATKAVASVPSVVKGGYAGITNGIGKAPPPSAPPSPQQPWAVQVLNASWNDLTEARMEYTKAKTAPWHFVRLWEAHYNMKVKETDYKKEFRYARSVARYSSDPDERGTLIETKNGPEWAWSPSGYRRGKFSRLTDSIKMGFAEELRRKS